MAIEAIGRLADLHIADDLEGKLRLFGQYDSVHDDLKTKGLSALFCGGSSQSVQQDAAAVVEDVESDIDSICSAWRQQGQYDRANELQAQVSLFKKLSSEGAVAEGPAILRFLLQLGRPDLPANVQRGCGLAFAYQRQRLQTLLQLSESTPVYPTHRPLDYSDTCLARTHQPIADYVYRPRPYMQYDSGVFSSLPSSSNAEHEQCGELSVQGQPVEDWLKSCSRPYWMQQVQHQSVYSGDGSLFGALTHGQVARLGDKLRIPHLKDPTDGEEARMSDVLSSLRSSSYDSSATLDRLHHVLATHRQQSAVDSRSQSTFALSRVSDAQGQSYLSEAGSVAMDAVLEETMHLGSSTPIEVTSQSQIIHDCCVAMLGVPSQTFSCDSGDHLKLERCHVVGFSGLALERALSSVATWGNAYRRLLRLTRTDAGSMCRRLVTGPRSYTLVQRAFCDGLLDYLQCYRAALLDLCTGDKSASRNILSLHTSIAPLGRQLLFILAVSTAAAATPSDDHDDVLLPTCALLSSLYKQASEHQHSQHYAALLHLFATALQPYLQFLHRWMEDGRWDDIFGEFFLRVDEQSLALRDVRYWQHGYRVARGAGRGEPIIPLFLASIAEKLIGCGKAVELLRQCSPNHPLLAAGQARMDLRLRFSINGLHESMLACSDFVQERDNALHALQRQSEEKDEELRLGIIHAAEQSKKRQEAEQAKKEVQRGLERDEQQRTLQELKDNMVAEQERKAADVARERKEDAELIRGMLEKDAEQERLENEARAELIARYEKLSADAEQRRVRAEWQTKRLALHEERVKAIADNAARDAAADSQTGAESGPPAAAMSSKVNPSSRSDDAGLPAHSDGSLPAIVDTLPVVGSDVSLPSIGTSQSSPGNVPVNRSSVDAAGQTAAHTILQSSATSVQPATSLPPVSAASPRNRGQGDSVDGDAVDSGGAEEFTSDTVVLVPRSTVTSFSSRPHAHDGNSGDSQDPTLHKATATAAETATTTALAAAATAASVTAATVRAPSTDSSSIQRPTVTHSPGPAVTLAAAGKEISGKESPALSIGSDDKEGNGAVDVLTHTAVDAYELDAEHTECDGQRPKVSESESERCIETSRRTAGLRPLTIDFSGLDQPPAIGKMTERRNHDDDEDRCLDAIETFPLSVIIRRCLLDPLLAQSRAANDALLHHFLADLAIGKHFAALRRYLLLECGEFGQALGERLFNQLSSGQSVHTIRSPMALSDLLSHALRQAQQQDSPDAKRLSFSIRHTSGTFRPSSVGAFNFLRINYQIDWPLNIVITDDSMSKYNKVFLFLLEMKRASWLLKDCLFYLKNRADHDGEHNRFVYRSQQFRQAQLFRHEMQHFVQSVEGYLSDQVIQVSWKEFQVDLAEEAFDLDRLIHCHSEYLRKLLFRSFLSQKATAVMKIVAEVLSTVLRFHTQLVTGRWEFTTSDDGSTTWATHSHFDAVRATHQSFKKYSGFLFNVVTKMVERSYQSHLDEFLLCLNFNSYYKPVLGTSAPSSITASDAGGGGGGGSGASE